MKILLILGLICLVATPVGASDDEKFFFDRNTWKQMSREMKIAYLNGLQEGITIGSLVSALAGIEYGGSSFNDVADYIDDFYRDVRNTQVAVPFAMLTLAFELEGHSKETMDTIVRFMRSQNQADMILYLMEIQQNPTKNKSNEESNSQEYEIPADILLDH